MICAISFPPPIFFRLRAQARVENPPAIIVGENEVEESTMAPLADADIRHSAAVIVAAFLNPSKLD